MFRKLFKILFGLVAAVIAISLIAVGSISVWVLTGPKSVAKLVPYVEQAMNPPESAVQVKLDDVIIMWQSMDSPLDIRIKNVRVTTRELEPTRLAKLDEVSIGIDFKALLRLKVMPRTIRLRSPSVRLFKDEMGEYALGIGEQESERVPLKLLLSSFGHSDPKKPEEDTANGNQASQVARGIDSIIISDARFILVEAGGEALIDAPNTDLRLTREPNAIRADIDFALRHRETDATIHAALRFANSQDMITGKVELQNLSPMFFERLIPEEYSEVKFDVPLSGWADIVIQDSGELGLLDFSFDGAHGVFEYPTHFAEPLNIRQLHMQGQLRDDLKQLTIKQANFDFGGATLVLNGMVKRALYDALADLPEGVEASPEQQIVKKEGIVCDLVAVAENMPTNDLYKYWPKTLASTSYEWVTTRIREGVVPHAEAKFKLTEEDLGKVIPESSFSAKIQAKGATVHYLDGHPKVEDVNGTVAFDTKSMEIRSQHGKMLSGGVLKDAFLKIPDLMASPPTMHIALKLEAPAKDVATYLAIEPLDYAAPLGLDPEKIKGDADATLTFDFNLPSNKLPEAETDLRLAIEANLKDAVQPGFMGNMNLSAVNGQLGITQDQATYKGMMSLDGVPLEVALVHDFHSTEEFPTHYQAKGEVLAEQLKIFGIPEMDFVSGKINLLADIKRKEGNHNSFTVIADLTPFAVDQKELGLNKPAGVKATLKAEGEMASGTLALRAFQVEGDEVHLVGAAAISDGFKKLASLKLDRVEFADNNFAGTIEGMDDGGYKIRAKGPSLDLKHYFAVEEAKAEAQRLAGEIPTSEPLPFRIDFHGEFDWIVIGKERELRNVNAKMVMNPDYTESALVRGITGQDNNFYTEIGMLSGKRRFVFQTDNAGSFFQAMDFYDGMAGGKLSLGGEFDDSKPERPLIGKFQITENTIKNAPVLAKIASLMSLTGIADSLSGKGVSVDRIEGDMEATDHYILLRNAKAVGPALGLTVDEGRVNRVTDELWMAGTFVPSYTLNTVLDNIPVLGEVISGGKGEGMFAAKYTVNGVYPDTIDVDIDALSMLAPGFLRNLVATSQKPPQDPVNITPKSE